MDYSDDDAGKLPQNAGTYIPLYKVQCLKRMNLQCQKLFTLNLNLKNHCFTATKTLRYNRKLRIYKDFISTQRLSSTSMTYGGKFHYLSHTFSFFKVVKITLPTFCRPTMILLLGGLGVVRSRENCQFILYCNNY